MKITSDIIDAQKELIKQYEEEEHECSTLSCPTCVLLKDPKSKFCRECYNDIFAPYTVNPCTERKVEPNSSQALTHRQKNMLLAYHESVLKYFEDHEGKELDESVLIELDELYGNE